MEQIRRERQEDAFPVRCVLEAAFPTPAEADLVERLRASSKAVIALVAEDEGQAVGHIVFSPLALKPLAGTVGLGLGPIAVLPDHEKHGVGRRLVQNGLAECRAWGASFVTVLGDPDYYGRFGFEPASAHGLLNEFGAGAAFMVFELKNGGLPPRGTLIKYAAEFADRTKPLRGNA
jgi:putative acetyltransferase